MNIIFSLSRYSVLFFCCFFYISLSGQTNHVLKFNEDGKFKIVQFTDVHFKYNNPASDIALVRINEILDAEKPDLVIFTGDIIFSSPAKKGMLQVMEQVSNREIPFVATFGNHDDEHGVSRIELYDLIRKVPHSLLPKRKMHSSPDYVLTIKSSSEKKKDAALLYCMDSNAYSRLKDVKGYGWISFEQVQWYRYKSLDYKEKNNDRSLPALAFFHIPVPEFAEAAASPEAIVHGTRMEKVCCPAINTGLFAAMKESGDVMGVFVGHDHDNDYAVLWHNILLAYGRYTGGNTVYNNLPNGARVIELEEGKRTFTTWIRQKDNEVVHKHVYPDSFRRN